MEVIEFGQAISLTCLKNSFVYLAVILDVFTRAIRAWFLSRSLDQQWLRQLRGQKERDWFTKRQSKRLANCQPFMLVELDLSYSHEDLQEMLLLSLFLIVVLLSPPFFPKR